MKFPTNHVVMTTSLNHKEIDAILSEIPFEGARIQDIYQPKIHDMYMEFYADRRLWKLYVCLLRNQVRLHLVQNRSPKPKIPQRFQQLLQSKIVGMRIRHCSQIESNRIIAMHLERRSPSERQEYRLYFRLWSNNANIICTDRNNTIVDLLYRRPAQHLMPKMPFTLPAIKKSSQHYTIRSWEGENFNAAIEKQYHIPQPSSSKKYYKDRIHDILLSDFLRISDSKEKIEHAIEKSSPFEHYLKWGNRILEKLHTIDTSTSFVLDADGTHIPLDTARSPIENAHLYFKKARKSKRRLEALTARKTQLSEKLHTLSLLKQRCDLLPDSECDLENSDKHLFSYITNCEKQTTTKAATRARVAKHPYGIVLKKDGFLILVGRSARENDLLLRHSARGDDMWMHVYGYRGGFVFIRASNPKKRSTSIPLSLLLDCAQLSAFYSKARTQTTADIHYTKVKYLRRLKDEVGKVVPSHVKTFHITVRTEEARKFIRTYDIKKEHSTI